MVKLIEGGFEEYPDVKVYFEQAEETTLYPMVRMSEVAEGERLERLEKFMRGQTMPLLAGYPNDLMWFHDYQNFLNLEKTGKELFWD
jgi:hypothetical protein